MKIFLFIGIIFFVTLALGFFYFFKKKEKDFSFESKVTVDEVSTDSAFNTERKETLDNSSFNWYPSHSEHEADVLGVVVEWNIKNERVLLKGSKVGDAFLYLGTGEKYLEPSIEREILIGTKSLIQKANVILSDAEIRSEINPPKENGINFVFFTEKRKYLITEDFKKNQNIDSICADYFRDAENLILKIKKTKEGDFSFEAPNDEPEEIPHDILVKLKKDFPKEKDFEKSLDLVNRIKENAMPVGWIQLSRAVIIKADRDLMKMERMIENHYGGDPRDLLINLMKMPGNTNYYGITPFEIEE